MVEIHDEEYWPSQLEINLEDCDEIATQLECVHVPQDCQAIVRLFVKRKLQQDQIPNQIFPGEQIENRQFRSLAELTEMIMSQYGEQIRNHLEIALAQDSRFTSLEGKWYLRRKLYHVSRESLQDLHHFLLQNQPSFLDAILSVIKENSIADPFLAKMTINAALENVPECFEKIGGSADTEWKARLPEHDRAQVTHYAFDPQTFEILCRPGQRLSRKKAQRLQELKLYAYVVTFQEWNSLANR